MKITHSAKMSKPIIISLAILLLVSAILGGCSNGASEDTPTPPASQAPSASPGQVPEEAETKLPITDEPVTFTFYYPFQNTYISTRSESIAVQEMEKRTNVHIEWIEPSISGDAATVYSLMFNSGDYSDFITMHAGITAGVVTYPGGNEQGVREGVFMVLNDLIDQYCPNYKEIINTWGLAYQKETRLDDGTIYSFYTLAKEPEYANFAMLVRQDLLDQVGLDKPVTIDDWENMLTAFKENFPNMIPLTSSPLFDAIPIVHSYSGAFDGSNFVSAFGIANEFYQVDGEVRFGPAQPEFKEYLKLMNKWYNLGLLDREFATRPIELAEYAELFCSFDCSWGLSRSRMYAVGATTNEKLDLRAVRAPVLNKGDKIEFRVNPSPVLAPNVITTALDHDIDVACKWFDYQYTEEAMLLNCYGIQGVSWEYDENGEPVFAGEYMAKFNEFGQDVDLYFTRDSIYGPGLIDLTRNYKQPPSIILECSKEMEVWQQDGTAHVLPENLSFTVEESERYHPLYNDIKTYVVEYVCKAISGQASTEDFDKFVEQLNRMGLEEVVQIHQNAFDRYMAR